jgi:hypothetical protein
VNRFPVLLSATNSYLQQALMSNFPFALLGWSLMGCLLHLESGGLWKNASCAGSALHVLSKTAFAIDDTR